jgi:hypothetical protein
MPGKQPAALDRGEASATNYIGLEIKNLMFMTLIAANRLIVSIDTHRI